MKIITLPVSDLHPADYNPRKDLAPGDKQYEKLARSIETFGYVEPIVWNRTTGNIVGGHQRLKVLVQKGYTEVQVVEVELNEQEERILNVSLNKISGRWDNEKLKRNIDRFGVVVPVIWNKRTNRVVSGHQRLTVLMNEGVTETDVSVVDLDETAEKQLNIAMNKVTGEWDEVKLKELLDGLGDAAPETGFDLYEIEALENNVDALVDGDFLDSELKSIEETFNISLKFSAEDRDVLKEYIKDNGKEDLVAVIVQKIRGEI